MADTAHTIHITQIGTVIIPVGDQERALEFYTTMLGFRQVADFAYADGERWLEVSPPGSPTRLALARAPVGRPAGIETGIAMGSDELEADHAALRARGVDVDDTILRSGDPVVSWAGATLAGVPPMFRFRDPDRNSFLIVEAG
jgi:catechol 2,3-dioxygenase-like lactoylglutathione lyase family enzyme